MTIITAEILITEFFKVTKERIVSFYRLKEIGQEYEKDNKGTHVEYTKDNLRKVALGNPQIFILKGDYIVTKKREFASQISDNERIGNLIASINAKLFT